MQEFTTVSASSYDPAALATKLTEKASEGWSVAGIVSTGGDVTAFLSRVSDGASSSSTDSAASDSSSDGSSGSALTGSGVTGSSSTAAYTTPSSNEPPKVTEPAGWATAPSSSSSPSGAGFGSDSGSSSAPMAPIAEQQSYAPAAGAYNPAPSAPAVPAGWYADPANRFELRYWDGSTWTEHVSRAGQQYTDPPVA